MESSRREWPARVDPVHDPELADPPQPLHQRGVEDDDLERGQPDRPPDGVVDLLARPLRRVGIASTRDVCGTAPRRLLDGLPVGRDAGRLLGLVGGSRSGRSRCPACHATSSCRSLLRKGPAPRPALGNTEQPVSELNVHLGGAGQPVEEGRGVGGIDLQPDPLELGIIQADQVPLGSLVQGLLKVRRPWWTGLRAFGT